MSSLHLSLLLILFLDVVLGENKNHFPIVINTWRFTRATDEAWKALLHHKSALDTVQIGCSACEVVQCDGTVGYGGSPDEDGETTLDSMIMDGNKLNVGGVIGLRRIKNAIGVARAVLDHTGHSILTGDKATQFAVQMGFKEESLTTDASKAIWSNWKDNNCQPNFWENVLPDPRKSCGPYRSMAIQKGSQDSSGKYEVGPDNHDTIGMIAIDEGGNIAAGTSTNGANHKIPGRVADSAVPGSGAYADASVGGAAATGDGDIMLRFSPSFLAVEEMRRGASPTEACQTAVLRIASHYPTFSGAVIAIDKYGNYGAACHGIDNFPMSIADQSSQGVRVEIFPCVNINDVKISKNEV